MDKKDIYDTKDYFRRIETNLEVLKLQIDELKIVIEDKYVKIKSEEIEINPIASSLIAFEKAIILLKSVNLEEVTQKNSFEHYIRGLEPILVDLRELKDDDKND